MAGNHFVMYRTLNRNDSYEKTDFLRLIFLYFILFGLEFDIRIYGPFTMRKISFLAGLLYIAYRGIPPKMPFKKSYAVWGMSACVLFFYTLFIQTIRTESYMIAGNASYSAVQIIFLAITFFFFPLMISQIFNSLDEFFEVQLGIISIQSLVAIFSRLYQPLRLYIYHHFVSDDGRMLNGVESGIRVAILGNIGAGASWILFSGCIICAYFMITTKRIKYAVLYSLISFAMMFVGRTGLYMALLLLMILFLYFLYRYAIFSVTIMGIGLLALLLIAAYILFAPESYLKSRTISWVGELFFRGTGEGSTVNELRNMPIPPLNWETFWGTGITYGVTQSGILIQSDVGYVQTYAALGVCGGLFYYIWTLGFFALEIRKISKKHVKFILWLFWLFTIIVEWKEPFLRKTSSAMVLMGAVMLQQKNECYPEREEYATK